MSDVESLSKVDTIMNNNSRNAALIRNASKASVLTAVVLIVAKLSAWGVTGSVSLLATLIDSLLDVFASLINLFAIHIALKPADEDHHFGHGKAEQLAGLTQSAFIAGSALFLILHAIHDFRSGSNLENEPVALTVMVFSMISTSLLIVYQSYVVRQTGSIAIRADSMHYRMDLLTNGFVIIALVLATQGYKEADALFGILIAIYMLISVRTIAWDSIQMLMDRALPESDLEEINKIILGVIGVDGVHNLRTRLSGTVPVIQFDLDVDGEKSVRQGA